ncbi:MAG: sulfotransferase [Anaerolineae bacterium]
MPVKIILSRAFLALEKTQAKIRFAKNSKRPSALSDRLIDAAYKLDNRNALATYKKGLKQAERKNWTEALNAYQDTLQCKEPPPPSFYHHYGITLLAVGAEVMAKQAFQMSLYYLPDAYWSAYELGLIHFKLAQYAEAEKCFRHVIKLSADHEWSHLHLAHTLVAGRGKDFIDEAIELYLKFADQQPDNPAAYHPLRNSGIFPRLISQHHISKVNKLVEKYPDAQYPKWLLGWIKSALLQTDEAISLFKEVSLTRLQLNNPQFQHLINLDQSSLPPAFIIIGPSKTGTSSLFDWLSKHPQIAPPLQKEVRFLNNYFEQGFDWYQSHFPPISQSSKSDTPIYGPDNPEFWQNRSTVGPITGEASPAYLPYAKHAAALKEKYPNLKLIVLHRNPVKRAFSNFQMLKRSGHSHGVWSDFVKGELDQLGDRQLSKETDFSQVNSLLARSCILPQLQQWLDVFPVDQMLVLNSEKMFANPQQTIDRMTQFLGLDRFKLTEFENVNPGRYRPMSPKLEKYLTNWFAPHEQELATYLKEHQLMTLPKNREKRGSDFDSLVEYAAPVPHSNYDSG